MVAFALCFQMRFDFPSGTSALRILCFALPDQIEQCVGARKEVARTHKPALWTLWPGPDTVGHDESTY